MATAMVMTAAVPVMSAMVDLRGGGRHPRRGVHRRTVGPNRSGIAAGDTAAAMISAATTMMMAAATATMPLPRMSDRGR
jgi:hypothetical protein